MTSAAWVALGAALASLLWALWSWRRVEFRARAHENMKLMMGVESKLVELPSALRFHGVSERQIQETGLSVSEFIYIVSSFSAGQTFYEFESLNTTIPFPQNDYRGIMCSNPDIAKAWPLLCTFLDDTPFRSKLETSIKRYAPATKAPPKPAASAA